jgi:choline dehydrogenase-like flavoprotein
MGTNVSRGVVDGELRTFGVPNLTVISTATFPTGGGSNPTMMLMMAALRAAERISQEFR